MEKVHERGTVLDHHGQPVNKKQLTEEVVTASLTGVRNVWHNHTVASGLTPETLAALLHNAANNQPYEYLVLAEEMEERDLHYQSVLGTRKRAISGLDVTVEAFSDDKQDIKLTDEVRAITRMPAFGIMIDDALDALGKGYSVNEILWDKSESQWMPSQYRYRDPKFFIFDQINGRELRLLDDENNYEGIALSPYKFITHIPRLKSGLPIRGGLARLVATAYMCKAYSITDWLAFAEVFGMPLRLGKYGTQASEDDIHKLISAVANIGSDAAAVIPDSMKIEFEKSGTTSGGDKLFQNLAEWLDRQISKAVLGQTMTSDDGSSQAQANVHNDVRKDILKADATQLEHTLNRDLIKPFIDLNFGVQKNYPLIKLPVPEPEDMTLLVNALKELVPLGLKVEESQVRDKLGISDPDKKSDLLHPTQTDSNKPMDRQEHNKTGNHKTAINHRQCSCCHSTALNEQENTDPDWLDELEAEAMEEWELQMEPIIDPVLSLAEEAQSYDEFMARLPELLETMKPDELIKKLAEQTFKARGVGDASDPSHLQ